MAYDNIINRAGTQAVAGGAKAAGTKHSSRHPQTGQFVRKGVAPIKKSGTRKLPTKR
jgi:hypothetical protein